MIYPAIGIGIITCLIAFFLSQYLVRKNIIDIPSERSSHATEKPRGGGISFILGISAILGLAWYRGIIDLPLLLVISLPGLMIAIVGFIDDVKSLTLKPRLITQVCAAAIAICLIPLPGIQFGSYSLDQTFWLIPLYLLSTIWFINLYNFMDGIDGIASLEAISILLSAGYILALDQDSDSASLLFALTAPVLGFLVWNFPRSIIFMGDVGSGYLGFILAMAAYWTSATTSLNIWTWIILGTLFIADSTYTLIHRIRSGQAWTQPHSLHGYQILARRLDSHTRVNAILLGVNLLYLLPLAWYSTKSPGHAWILTLVAYIPFIVAYRILGAGNPSTNPENS
jgi:Fuc2NAc and GlcNAc transferase